MINQLLTNKKEQTRFIRFAIVGAIGAVVDFAIFNLLAVIFPDGKNIIFQSISFTAAVISNFLWNRFWTYPDSRSKQISSQLTQFFVVNLIGLGIRTLIYSGFEKLFLNIFTPMTALPLSAETISKNLALAGAIGIVMIWNFFINRIWTYNDVED
ncbi:MAG: GtrA family protein [Anaerolineaceae bacterium]|nr:GtrA family protein [Anaerolineaceae bacterium]